MIDKEDILYMIAHIAHKELEYKWVSEFIQIPNYEQDDMLGFAVVITEDGSGMDLLFRTVDGYVTYYGDIGRIMEPLFRGTGTEHIVFSDAVFDVNDFDFDVVQSAGEYIEYA